MMDRNWSVCPDARSLIDVAPPIPPTSDYCKPIPPKADQEIKDCECVDMRIRKQKCNDNFSEVARPILCPWLQQKVHSELY